MTGVHKGKRRHPCASDYRGGNGFSKRAFWEKGAGAGFQRMKIVSAGLKVKARCKAFALS
jgi:hypothetical protein